MKNGSTFVILVNKLEEQGVISKQHAKILRPLAKLLDTPAGRIVRFLVIKAIAHIILNNMRDR